MGGTALATAAGRKKGKSKTRLTTMVAAALANPVRTKIFAILGERVASPAEISRELLIEVNSISHHVKTLFEWGLIEQVGHRPVRGAVEHFYKAIEYPELNEHEEETQLSAERRQHAEIVLSMFTADAVRSIDMGLLFERTDHYLTRFAYDVDEQGWRETFDAYRECFEQVKKIQAETAERLEEKNAEGSNEKPLRLMSFLGMFQLPPLRTRAGASEIVP